MSLDSLLQRKIKKPQPLTPTRLVDGKGKEKENDKGKEKETERELADKEKMMKLEKGKEKECDTTLENDHLSESDTSTEFAGDYMQDMVFTTEVNEEGPSVESMIKVVEKEPAEGKSDLYLGLREYVTENFFQIRGETDDSDSSDSDDSSSSFESSNSSGTAESSGSPSLNQSRFSTENLPTDYREIEFAELILQERVGKIYPHFAS